MPTIASTPGRTASRGIPPLAVTLLLAAACGSEQQDAPLDSARDAAPVVSDARSPGASTGAAADAAGGCRLTGAWQRCSAVESVERAGYRLELLRDSVVQPGIDVAGAAYRLGSAELQLFVHADSVSAAAAAAAIDADDAEPAETRGIRRAPAVIQQNNLVALLFDNSDRLRERVRLALAAGLPTS